MAPPTRSRRCWGRTTSGWRALLRPGELIYVSTAPRPSDRAERAAARLALVMVRADAQSPDRADGSVRLVQDFGRPDDPAPGLAHAAASAPAAPLKRGRGRPPGSRTKKAGAAPTGSPRESAPQA